MSKKSKKIPHGKLTDHAADLTAIRDEKCIGIARKVLTIIAECAQNAPMGEAKEETRGKFEDGYKDATARVLTVFLEADLQLKDIEHVKQLVLQPGSWILNMASASVQRHVQNAELAAFGVLVPDMGFRQLDAVLKDAAQKRLDALAKQKE